jgi:parallel beta-helix repeat protein
VSLSSLAALAGPLDPPAGPVASTGRFGPRIEVNATNTPGDSYSLFKITQPGSYYLGGNITGVAGMNGIAIDSDDVTLDLNGFAVLGVAGSLDGIIAAEWPSLLTDITIRNGTVADWGGDGIYVEVGFNVRIDEVQASRNTNYGIFLDSGSGNAVTNCTAIYNGFSGIDAGVGSTVHLCTSLYNGIDGIAVSNGGSVTNCTANHNTGNGIKVGTKSRVVGNHCVDNGEGAGDGAGIYVWGNNNRIESNNVSHNDRGIDVDGQDNIIVKNTASENDDGGVPSNYTFPLGVLNAVGEIVDVTSTITITETSSAWANFEY